MDALQALDWDGPSNAPGKKADALALGRAARGVSEQNCALPPITAQRGLRGDPWEFHCMADIAQLNQGRFYWVLVRSSTKDLEWQPARFAGHAGHRGAKWDFIGFNSDVGHHFVEVVEIGPELAEHPGLPPSMS